MARFAVLMRENDHAWSKLPEARQQELLRLYGTWVDELKAAGALLGGDAIGEGGRLLRATGGAVEVGPFTASRDVLTGYFLIEAPDLDAAASIARGCPALLHGETVEVRPLGHA